MGHYGDLYDAEADRVKKLMAERRALSRTDTSNMTKEQLFEDLRERLIGEMDRATLEAGLSLSEAAEVAKDLASEFRDRANQLRAEAGE